MMRRRTFPCNHQFVGVNVESSREGGEETQEAGGRQRTLECRLQRQRRIFVSAAANGSYLPQSLTLASPW